MFVRRAVRISTRNLWAARRGCGGFCRCGSTRWWISSWKIIIDPIRSLNQSIAELEETIGKEGQKREGHQNLTSIQGIGGLSTGILLSIIVDIGDFSNEGSLASLQLRRLICQTDVAS